MIIDLNQFITIFIYALAYSLKLMKMITLYTLFE